MQTLGEIHHCAVPSGLCPPARASSSEVYSASDEKNLAAGDVVKQTQSAVVLEKLIGQFLFSKAADGGK